MSIATSLERRETHNVGELLELPWVRGAWGCGQSVIIFLPCLQTRPREPVSQRIVMRHSQSTQSPASISCKTAAITEDLCHDDIAAECRRW